MSLSPVACRPFSSRRDFHPSQQALPPCLPFLRHFLRLSFRTSPPSSPPPLHRLLLPNSVAHRCSPLAPPAVSVVPLSRTIKSSSTRPSSPPKGPSPASASRRLLPDTMVDTLHDPSTRTKPSDRQTTEFSLFQFDLFFPLVFVSLPLFDLCMFVPLLQYPMVTLPSLSFLSLFPSLPSPASRFVAGRPSSRLCSFRTVNLSPSFPFVWQFSYSAVALYFHTPCSASSSRCSLSLSSLPARLARLLLPVLSLGSLT
jgi:hypothetical protein